MNILHTIDFLNASLGCFQGVDGCVKLVGIFKYLPYILGNVFEGFLKTFGRILLFLVHLGYLRHLVSLSVITLE